MPYDLTSNNEAKAFYMYKKEHLRHKMFLAFNNIPTSGSFFMKFELSTIASGEGPDVSVLMWNLDRAFSPDERR